MNKEKIDDMDYYEKISDYCSLDTVNNSLFPVKFAHRL